MVRIFAVLAAATVLAGCGSQNKLIVGAVDDSARFGDARLAMKLAADSGFEAVALSAVWKRGETAPPAADLAALGRAVSAADANHVRPIVAVYSFSADTPSSDADRSDFAAYCAALVRGLPKLGDVVVGNEPNLNLFWLPQFTDSGADAAAAAFEQLLAASYDAIKAVRSDVQVIGAGLSPRGADDPSSPRATHSPTQFLLDLGSAYRASGRQAPIMDALAIHPYGESPRIPPSFVHPRSKSISIADYQKLVNVLGLAFGGTHQEGKKLPIVYGEYGVETEVPPDKAHAYTGREIVPTATAEVQARYYAAAIRLAACQPTVQMLLFFHVVDETRLEGLQSGVRYADSSPKPSLAAVRDTKRTC
ncbi:MAG TPA: hypothetical protein VGQ38_01760 [Gaiellaceae bacterium]|nr:hypothetical protein [Gaiellaceae bacterium]